MVLEDKLSTVIPENGVIDFYADWCAPCKMMEPVLDKMKTEGYNIIRVDTEENQDLAEYFEINSLPTFVKIEEGKEVSRKSGALSEENFKKFIQ